MALRLALYLLEAAIYVGALIGALGKTILYRPLRAVAVFVFRKVFIPIYQRYFTVKQWAIRIFAPAKNKILYPFLSKSTIHVVILVLALGVIANNLVIRETRAEEFGDDVLLNHLIANDQDFDIVETAITVAPTATNYGRLAGMVAPADLRVSRDSTEQGIGGVITTTASAAIVNPNLASTTAGDRPRENVEFYIVQGGDTVSTIAEQFNISTDTILWENRLGARDLIKPGSRLTILPVSGVSHQVKSGDTVQKIADRYKATADKIVEYNELIDAANIEQGQILIIPEGTMPAPTPAPRPASPSTTGASGYASSNIPPPSRAASTAQFLWPTPSRRINQYYGWRHTGVDIDGDYSSPIYAAESGVVETVIYANYGYGYHIIINHGGGYKTLYAHESKIFVKPGQSVSRGETIGMVGTTGRSTGTHLHFEIIINGRKVNPLSYL